MRIAISLFSAELPYKLLQGLYIFRNPKIQGFPGLFYRFIQGFSRALEAENENKVHDELFKTISRLH